MAAKLLRFDWRFRARWRARLVPALRREAWRGRVRPSMLRPLTAVPAPGAGAVVGHASRVVQVYRHRGRWALALPQHGRPSRAPAAVACTRAGAPPRVWAWSAALFRGLGGLRTLKLRFKGKSFRWHRRRGALMLRFGHSHLVVCRFPPAIRWRRLGRMKLLLYGTCALELRRVARRACAWRLPNMYHSRGLRLARQRLYRKGGKVSAYR
jgi:hypothetical protein